MKTVMFVSHTAELNGAELWLLQCLEGLNRDKFHPLLVVPRPGPLAERAETAGVEVVCIPFKWWLTEKRKTWKQPLSWLWSLRSVGRMARQIDERGVDLLFSNSSACLSGALAARFRRIPHVWAVHEMLGGKHSQLSFLLGQKALIRLIHSLSCRVVVSSRATGESFDKDDKVRLVYSGVKLPCGDPSDPKVVRSQFDISEEDVVLGIVGRICDQKGQKELIQALGMLGRAYPRLKLILVGRARDKKYVSSLYKLIERTHLGDRVIFAGFQKDIIPTLATLDCLFVVSKMESFGRTIIEAMSVGTPVIAVRSGGIPEIIRSGVNGLLLDSRDPVVLKDAILFFLRDRDAFEQAAKRGLETVKTHFLLAHQIKQTERVLEECIEPD